MGFISHTCHIFGAGFTSDHPGRGFVQSKRNKKGHGSNPSSQSESELDGSHSEFS